MKWSLVVVVMMFCLVCAGDDQVTWGNGDYQLDDGSGDNTLKWDRASNAYKLGSSEDAIVGFSFDANDGVFVDVQVELTFKQAGDHLLITAKGIHSTMQDIDKAEFISADVIGYLWDLQSHVTRLNASCCFSSWCYIAENHLSWITYYLTAVYPLVTHDGISINIYARITTCQYF